jgi:Zn-finger nucleic acid-binding protein
MVGNRREDYDVKYIKCPVCDKFMNRLNFGSRSGVIVDKCKEHGIWLDGGELKQIMEWTKAGGKLLDKEKKSEEKKIEDFREKQKARDFAIESAKSNKGGAYSFTIGKRGFGNTPMLSSASEDLVGLLIRFVRKFFL